MGILDRLTGSPREKFAHEALRIAQRMPGVASVTYDRAQFALAVRRTGSDAPAWIYLSNVYAESEGASSTVRRERIEQLVRVMTDPEEEETWASVRSKLRPVLRPATFGQSGATGVKPPLSRPAMPFLREFVVVDHPESMAYVVPDRLADWAVTVDEVFAAARANLEELAQATVEGQWPDDRTLVRIIDGGDGYFTSMLLVPHWLEQVSQRMGSRVIAFLPDTNTVQLCSLPDGGLGPLWDLVETDYREAVRGLSPVGYVADDRGVAVPFTPPAGHPDQVAARRADVVLASAEYEAQTQWLSRQYEQAGVDVYVGRLLTAAKSGQAAITVATWTDGITSLLPEAQYISFVSDSSPGPMVAWSVVAELVDLQPEPILAPTRYRVGAWPSPDVMDHLTARAEH